MLSMNVFFENNSPCELAKKIAVSMVKKRKLQKLSQSSLAQKSGVSLGSIKRFETKYEISLSSIIKIAIVLDSIEDFENLFSKKTYSSIDEVINE